MAVGKLKLSHVGLVYSTDYFFLLGVLIVAAVLVDRFLIRSHATGPSLFKKRLVVVALIARVTIFSSYPMLTDYLVHVHDLFFHYYRIQGLADGQFPVRLQPTAFDGKGYIASAMYPDLFLLPFAFLRLAGMSLVGCY